MKDNIRINLLAPGFAATEMTSGWLADPDCCEMVKGFNFVHRWAEPEEMAGMVLFLASPMASFMAGSIIMVDAGQTAH
jgi:NAD(P)-dependent dehydrogenase (short-subunit alcohol dehydrogenase family)